MSLKLHNFSHEQLMNDVTHVLLIRVVDLFTVSCGGNWNKQGGVSVVSGPFKCNFSS